MIYYMTSRKPSGGSATAAERMRRMRARQKEQGLQQVLVAVPAERADEIREIAATMRQEAEEKK